ncbi:MAG TPA: type II toxin-antitoxin system VapB family antitoxin [Mycobacteriales bacterium]
MRTNIEIDDALLAEAQELAGTRTKKATVEFALAELIRRRKAKGLLAYRGAVDLDIDLDTSRGGRTGW